MKYKIINILNGFQNAFGDLPWQVHCNGRYVQSFRTRHAAREYVKHNR